MVEMNRFVLEAGAIPTLAWLDGTSEGEASVEELFEVAVSLGTAALNIIPDRNYQQGVKDCRLQNLYNVVSIAERLQFPVIVGTVISPPRSAVARPTTAVVVRSAPCRSMRKATSTPGKRKCGCRWRPPIRPWVLPPICWCAPWVASTSR